ncbi:MAG TPA: hypothetical protein VN682_27125 [Terriglobales bacterium]|nr:hypothetical protein [Terriglobales bacterium]
MSRALRTALPSFKDGGASPASPGSLVRDAPKMSTTLEIYTVPIPAEQRAAVERFSVSMANDGKNGRSKLGRTADRFPAIQ